MATRRNFLKVAAAVAGLSNVNLLIDEQTEEVWIEQRIRIGPYDEPVTVRRRVPANLDDSYWLELVEDREKIHELALRSFIIHAQAAVRAQVRLDGDASRAQAAMDEYMYPSRARRESLVAELTPEQLALLVKYGLKP